MVGSGGGGGGWGWGGGGSQSTIKPNNQPKLTMTFKK